jgi:hypothetical protein
MVRQTQLDRDGTRESPVHIVARNAAGLWHHILNLAELQSRLFATELSDVLSRAEMGAGLIVAGGALALAGLPVAMTALALGLVQILQMSPAGAFTVVAASVLVIAAGLIMAGWRFARNGLGLPRTRQEWRLNWRWLKSTLRAESESARRSPPNGTHHL